ncbi:hypothetical protein VNO78_23398 [Psophocarpus tetragonolobus]|uniref:NEDD8 ultimate buster 1 n=1 Tax=Psophocarpus tetragonolobus TaxID=3891 RepID=A0AAN9S3M9_PSOTE
MAKVKISGIWSGTVEVELDTWTITMLREEVAKQSNYNPNSINFIYAGKILTNGDGQHNLTQLGIKNNAKILATRICVEEGKAIKEEIMAEEERAERLTRVNKSFEGKKKGVVGDGVGFANNDVREAATALAERHADGSLPTQDLNVPLHHHTPQLASGTDQRAIITALMLDANAKHLIKRGMYKEALEVLSIGKEAFSLCDPMAIELINNIPILQINIVWCYFMLQDISSLSEAGERLQMAREGLERAHGNNALRGYYTELALRMRLELLEGVVAYYSGQLDKARAALLSAREKFEKLQVSDEALSLLMSMGFTESDAKRALRMSSQNVGAALDFLIEDRQKKERKQQEEAQRGKEIREQKAYGMTPLNRPVDLLRLNDLVSIGFEKEVAAEALRKNENDFERALDDLTHPETISALQMESRKRKMREEIQDSSIEILVMMGFERSRAVAALQPDRNIYLAMQRLMAEGLGDPNMLREFSASAGPGDIASSSSFSLPHIASVGNVKGPSIPSGELSADTAESDALADYDIEVNIEGEAITEYLSLVESAATGGGEDKQQNDSAQ